MTTARVVGAGLSGLTAAWHLSHAGFDVEVVEAEARAGGLIETLDTPLGVVERGANAFVWTDTAAGLFRALDITPRFASAVARRRFIFRDGTVRRWPLGPRETLAMAARRARAAIRREASPRVAESVAAWSHRVYGPDATRWLIGPALQGIYGAPPDRLSARAIAGLGAGRRGRRSILAAPARGMSDLTNRMVDRLRQRGVSFSFGHALAALDPAVPTIVATNGRAAGALIAPHAPALGAALSALPMTSLTITTGLFPPSPDDIHGFGVLFPREGGIQSLGVRFDSDIFPGRQGRVETWIGQIAEGSGLRHHEADWPDPLAADRRVLTGRADDPIAAVTTRRPQSLPLYSAQVNEICERLHTLPPWIALAGNYMGRLGASKLLEVAAEAAVRIARYNAAAGPRRARESWSRQADDRSAGADRIQPEFQRRGAH